MGRRELEPQKASVPVQGKREYMCNEIRGDHDWPTVDHVQESRSFNIHSRINCLGQFLFSSSNILIGTDSRLKYVKVGT